MKTAVIDFIVGFIFAIGLALGGMTQPQKVIGFLDVTGSWDPSLLFIMLGAIPIHYLAYKAMAGRPSPIFAAEFMVPQKKEITARLIIGASLFGVGWGLAGYCPGPALTSVLSGFKNPTIFLGAMIAGMFVYNRLGSKPPIS